jgi:DNA-binding FadR family transcriptional regulator
VESHALTAPFDSRRAKLVGQTVAERIVADVIELGWPVGQVLGSEAELLARYGISRAVLREAVRLVEHQRVARMRRGPGGGLVIDEPDISTAINAVILHLLRVDATLSEVIDTRLVLEELVAESAAEQATEADIVPIRQALADEAAGDWTHDRLLHAALGSLTGNPVLDLFVDILTRVGDFFNVSTGGLPPRLRKEATEAHAQIAQAVLSNNPGLARVRMRRHLLAEADFIEKHHGNVQRLPAAAALQGAAGDKRAEAVARGIFAAVLKAKQPPGAFIGSEASLMAEYSASRAVVREAVRILDYHHIATMRRGPGGGLFVAAPDSSAVTDIIAIYLRRRGVAPNHVIEMLTGLELAVVERVAARLTSDDRDSVSAPLRAYLESGPGGGPHPGLDWHSLLASLTANSALELLHRVVMRLGWLFFSRLAEVDPAVRQLSEPSTVNPVHNGITEALLAGDKELAMMRMRAHRMPADA